MSKWVVEIWTPYEGMEAEEYDTPQQVLEAAKKRTKGGYSSATIRPATQEWEPWEFEEALNKGEIE